MFDLVICQAHVATMDAQDQIFPCAFVGIEHGLITYIGSKNPGPAREVIDAKGMLVTPGLIDCHTHVVYAGNRSHEFSQRLQGQTYAQIAQQGGGILSTVRATRLASEDELMRLALSRVQVMLQHGTTTVEIKSGYGLDLDTEVKLLTVARSLEKKLPISVVSTYLGAHAIPPEYQNRSEDYVDYIIAHVLPLIARKKLALFVDAFCEHIGFNSMQVERIFQAAIEYGLKLKLHAEQLTDQQGAVLAARYEACSVDHLEYLKSSDCVKLANGKTVAVLLPGAYYFLKETQLPPVQALREHRIPMAIATDANPGTSPFLTLPLMMNMACVLFGLNIQEAWKAVTLHAASALDLERVVGSLEVGKQADCIVWSTNSLDDIIYNPTMNFCDVIVKKGKKIQKI